MKVVDIEKVRENPLDTPLFTGQVIQKSLVADTEGSDLSVGQVHFPKGVRNKFHTHDHDQILIITHGKGIVAGKEKSHHVTKGDVVWIPSGEQHWHGASKDSDFTHITITRARTQLTQIKK